MTAKYNDVDLINSVELSVSPLLEESRSRSRKRSHWLRIGAYVSVRARSAGIRITQILNCITQSTQIEQVRFQRHLRLNYDEFGELVEENPSLIDLVPEVIFNAFAESAIEAGVSESLVDTLREAGERRQRSDCVCVRCDY